MDKQINYIKTDIFFTVANVLVFNEYNQILILKRAEWKFIKGEDYRPDLSRTPDLPGGIVADTDELESERSGVMRELLEETGVKVDEDQIKLVCASTSFNNISRRSCSNLVYILKLDFTPDIELSWEHEGFEWCDLEQVAYSHKMMGFHDTALNYLLEHRQLFGI